MKKKYFKPFCMMALSCSIILPAAHVLAEDMETSGSVTVGVQNLNINGDKSSKFEEYQDGLQEDIVLEHLQIQGEKDDLHFNVEGRDISQKDQSFVAEGGKYGKYKLQFKWDEIIHNFYEDATFLGTETGSGVWTVPDGTQSTLESNFASPDLATSPTAAEQAVLLDYLTNANKVELKVEREKGEMNLLYTLRKNLNIRAGFSHESKDGYRAMSTGLYRRAATGATAIGGLGENFRLYGLEFPEPIDNVTDEFSLGVDYREKTWHADLTYRFTSFSNDIADVTWDNPLLLTGQDDQQGGAALNRLDLAPDSVSHNVSLTGGLSDLPLKSKLTATLSWDNVTQDDKFLPYTANTAVLDDAGAVAANLALPDDNLDGDVTTTLVNLQLHSKPIDKLAVNLKYNYYDYKNDSSKITWDGWVGIGETTWKDYDGSTVGKDPFTNRVPEYARTKVGLDASYRINRMYTLKGDYKYEKYDRNDDRNADTTEDIFGGSIQIKPADWALIRLGYHYADRDIDGDYTAEVGLAHEWDELRMFDQSDRQRDTFDAFVSLDPTDHLSLGLSLSYNDEDYDTDFYGLHENKGYMAGIDGSYLLSDNIILTAYYSRDDYESKQLNRTKSDLLGGGAFAVPENDFATEINDTTDTVGASFVTRIIPGKLTLSLVVDYSRAEGEIDTSNPNYVAGITTSSATAYDWPELETKTTEIKADLKYNWTEQLSGGLHYLYKRFEMDDFATDDLLAYGTAPDTQGNNLSHFIFMDANYSDYKAHVVSATMSYSF